MSQKQAGPLSQVLLQPLSCNLVNNSFEAIVHRLYFMKVLPLLLVTFWIPSKTLVF